MRRGAQRDGAAVLGVDRNLAPAEHLLALAGDDRLDLGGRVLARLELGRQEADADAVRAPRREIDPRARELLAQEAVGDLEEDAGAVSGLGIGALGAAVLHVVERDERLPDHLVRRGRAQARDERDAAGIVLVGRVVQAPGDPVFSGTGHR